MLGQNCPSASSLVHWARLNAPGAVAVASLLAMVLLTTKLFTVLSNDRPPPWSALELSTMMLLKMSSSFHWFFLKSSTVPAGASAPGSGTVSPTASKSTSGVTAMQFAPALFALNPLGQINPPGAATITIVGGSVGPSAPTTY